MLKDNNKMTLFFKNSDTIFWLHSELSKYKFEIFPTIKVGKPVILC